MSITLVKSWIKRWLHHEHAWRTTLWNVYGAPLEQKCRCGQWRHRRLWSWGLRPPDIEWHPGPHRRRP